jgi:hypothetical protein
MFRLLKEALKFTMGDHVQESVLQWFRQILACASMGLLSMCDGFFLITAMQLPVSILEHVSVVCAPYNQRRKLKIHRNMLKQKLAHCNSLSNIKAPKNYSEICHTPVTTVGASAAITVTMIPTIRHTKPFKQ